MMWRQGFCRGLALALGGFACVNVALHLVWPEYDANLLWIDLRILPGLAAIAIVTGGGAAMLSVAICPAAEGRWRRVRGLMVGVLLVVAIINTVTFYRLYADGRIDPGVPVPFTLLVAAAMMMMLWTPARRPTLSSHGLMVATAAACLLTLALSQMFFFGRTDYRRPADAIVVFGARAYADGRPSDALADRVRTGCELYHAGYAGRLIFSGGPGDGRFHETESMRRMAESLGVPADAIVRDTDGLNTQHTVRNTLPMFAELGCKRVLAVSHAYHLPRVKMTYQRAGLEVYTVPAKERYVLTKMPWLMAREVAAWWVYFVRPA